MSKLAHYEQINFFFTEFGVKENKWLADRLLGKLIFKNANVVAYLSYYPPDQVISNCGLQKEGLLIGSQGSFVCRLSACNYRLA